MPRHPLNKTHCINGHKYTFTSTRYNKDKKGYKTKKCRICEGIRYKLRYRNDKEFREKRKAASRNVYQCRLNPVLNQQPQSQDC